MICSCGGGGGGGGGGNAGAMHVRIVVCGLPLTGGDESVELGGGLLVGLR